MSLQSFYDSAFTREMGCTEAEWLGWLPAAIGDCPWERHGASVRVTIHDADNALVGHLKIEWSIEPSRRIALIKIPRMRVSFTFDGLDDAQRYRFMRRFDLYMHRGGG